MLRFNQTISSYGTLWLLEYQVKLFVIPCTVCVDQKEEKLANMKGVEIDPTEKDAGYRTAVDALGTSDPTTLAFSDESSLQGSVTVQGSTSIDSF